MGCRTSQRRRAWTIQSITTSSTANAVQVTQLIASAMLCPGSPIGDSSRTRAGIVSSAAITNGHSNRRSHRRWRSSMAGLFDGGGRVPQAAPLGR